MAVFVAATLLAFDDTDSPDGMCTTYLAALVLEELSEYDLIGLPRLVRLNPNIPWKTRGNAAICLPLGHGYGKGLPCGSVQGRELRYHLTGRPADPSELLERGSKVLERVARFECAETNPGIVASDKRPPPSMYWRAVRDIVPLRDVEAVLKSSGAQWKKFKKGRGIIGAAAAMAWRPRDRTFEVIAYRSPRRFGTPRRIRPQSVIEMDRATKKTFNNYDYENGHIAIAPGSPCPILFGIRGDSQDELLEAKDMIRGERPDKWLLFLTNQGTDDHIVHRRVAELEPMMSARIDVRVAGPPKTIPGGHVIVRVSDGHEIDAAFYEPSRGFRESARALIPGDEVTLYGSIRSTPRSLNVEKMRVRRLAQDVRKVHNPVCPKCGKSMGSMGTGQGFRCKRCGMKLDLGKAIRERYPRRIKTGWFEPPVASRRHLHKPLRRLSRVDIDRDK
jgi:tRNA(Ile2)-agmatinylcytidine synthase